MKHNKKRISFIPKDTVLTGFYWLKTDFARNEVTLVRRNEVKAGVVLSKVEGKQSPKNNRNAKAIDCHELYGKLGEIASSPAGGSQNQYTYYA